MGQGQFGNKDISFFIYPCSTSRSLLLLSSFSQSCSNRENLLLHRTCDLVRIGCLSKIQKSKLLCLSMQILLLLLSVQFTIVSQIVIITKGITTF